MKRLRIGKDFGLSWKIKAKNVGENAPYTPSSDSVLLLVTPYNKVKAEGATFDGDTVRWIFRGKDQKHLGVYGLELVENQGENGMITIDTCEAFELVAHSCEETGHDGESLIFDTLEFITDVELNALRGPQGPPGPGAATPDWAAQSYEEGYIKNKRFGIKELLPIDLRMPYSELRKVDLEGLVYGFQAYEYPLDESLYDPFVSSDDNPDAMDIFNIANSGEGRVVRISDLAWNIGHRYIELTKENFNQNVSDVCGLPYVTVWIPMISEHYLAVVNDKCYIIANIVGTFNPNPSDYLQVYESYRLPETYISEDIARVEDVYEELIPIWENVDRIDKEISNLSKEIENLPSGESSVFEAVYGVTTYNEIIEAHNEGKIVICEYDVWVCRLTKIQASQVMFQASADSSVTRLTCNTKGQWSLGTSSTFHNLKQLDNGNVEITINAKTAEVASGTPSGDPMHYMYEAVGAEWNGTGADIEKQGVYGDTITHKAGYWYLNELGDITTEEMRLIYAESQPMVRRINLEDAFSGSTIRTNIPIWDANRYTTFGSIPHTASELRGVCKDAQIEVFAFIKGPMDRNIQKHMVFSASSLSCAFRYAEKLSKIIGCLNCATPTDNKCFEDAYLLKEVRLIRLKNSFSFSNSPLLSKDSVLFAVQNSEATSAITITLHADAYDRAMADAEITAALEAHPNVSLASA
jgi:hypothetical protein